MGVTDDRDRGVRVKGPIHHIPAVAEDQMIAVEPLRQNALSLAGFVNICRRHDREIQRAVGLVGGKLYHIIREARILIIRSLFHPAYKFVADGAALAFGKDDLRINRRFDHGGEIGVIVIVPLDQGHLLHHRVLTAFHTDVVHVPFVLLRRFGESTATNAAIQLMLHIIQGDPLGVRMITCKDKRIFIVANRVVTALTVMIRRAARFGTRFGKKIIGQRESPAGGAGVQEAVVIAVADRDRVSVAARDRFDRALTGDPDIADALVLTAADAGAVLAAVGVYLGIDDLDMTAVSVLTAADTRAVYAAPRIHGRALELDIAAVAVVTAADACGITAAGRLDGGSDDGDVAAVAALTAADTCAVGRAVSCNIRTLDGDIAAADAVTAADTRAVAPAMSDYGRV